MERNAAPWRRGHLRFSLIIPSGISKLERNFLHVRKTVLLPSPFRVADLIVFFFFLKQYLYF